MDVVQSDASLDLAARAVEAVESLLEGLEQTAALDPGETNNVLYRGLVAFIVQLAFVRLAEARGVLPKTYPPASNRMSVHQICATLADLPANGPTSTAAQLVHLFRAIHDGVLQAPVSLGDLLGSRGSVLAKLDDVAVATALRQLAAFQDPNLDIEHLGTLYESLMGYEVKQTTSAAARVGKRGVWVEIEALRTLPPRRRAHWLKTTCGVSANQQKSIEALLDEHANEIVCAQAISALGTSTSPARRWAGSGSLVLVSGTRRRLSGSHYTPRVLTKHIVAQALAPVLSSLGARPTAEQILNLTICDPAMGSGAFLLEACRQLSEHVVAAWKRHGCLEDVAARHGLPLRYARFLVAQRCLHGVDKNPDAVELAKLSLWLLAANCEQDFTFVDHTLRHGDSLVGLDREQVLGFSWHRSPPVTAIAELINKAPHSPATRQSLRLIADLCIGAFFAHTTIKARNLERDRRLVLVTRWLAGETQLKPALTRLAATIRERHAPLHWWLEFPGISTGMDAMVGNPPFGGNNAIAALGGAPYQAWLKHAFDGERGVRGNCDISAFFLRRAAKYIGQSGTLGFVATNTIAQGATRAIGLKHLLAQAWQVYEASSSVAWPGSASVVVSIVVLARGEPATKLHPRLNGRRVDTINSRLHPRPERPDGVPLAKNQHQAFIGSYVLGKGFILTPQAHAALVGENRAYTKIIRPFIGGHEVNTHPNQLFHRYVIDFGQRSLAEAEQWPNLLQIVRTQVKPQRDRLHGNAAAGYRRRFWWRFAGAAPELYHELKQLDRCLVAAVVSKHLMFSFQPTDRVFSHKLCVVTLSSFTGFAILQSRIHVAWAWLLSSTMKTDLNYSPVSCFATFAFPTPNLRARLPHLEDAGRRFYEARARWMADTGVGLTKTYNALSDPTLADRGILDLRRRSEAMDQAVLEAYGWGDLSAPPMCPQTPGQTQALQTFTDAVIDRLYQLNERRGREEQSPPSDDVRP